MVSPCLNADSAYKLQLGDIDDTDLLGTGVVYKCQTAVLREYDPLRNLANGQTFLDRQAIRIDNRDYTGLVDDKGPPTVG